MLQFESGMRSSPCYPIFFRFSRLPPLSYKPLLKPGGSNRLFIGFELSEDKISVSPDIWRTQTVSPLLCYRSVCGTCSSMNPGRGVRPVLSQPPTLVGVSRIHAVYCATYGKNLKQSWKGEAASRWRRKRFILPHFASEVKTRRV